MSIVEDFVQFRHPFTALICGPTGCGKTELAKRIIDNLSTLVYPHVDKVYWHYAHYQPWFEQYGDKIICLKGLPEIDKLDPDVPKILFIDDQMQQASSTPVVEALFTRVSHHSNSSVFFVTQNLYFDSKSYRTISRNARYLILFRNLRDKRQISTLQTQLQAKFLADAYNHAISQRPYSYLLIDLHENTDDRVRYRTNIMPGERQIVYYG